MTAVLSAVLTPPALLPERGKPMQGQPVLVRAIALTAVFFSALAPCALGQSAGRTDYFPFKKGNFWSFAMVLGDVSIKSVAEISGVERIGDGEEAVVAWKTNGTVTQRERYRKDRAGLSRMESGMGLKLNPPMPVLKFPIQSGQTWTWTGTISGAGQELSGTMHVKVLGAAPVTTKAGKFKAVRVHMEGSMNMKTPSPQQVTIANDYWFAPGVGLVRQTATLGGQKISGAVEKYRVK